MPGRAFSWQEMLLGHVVNHYQVISFGIVFNCCISLSCIYLKKLLDITSNNLLLITNNFEIELGFILLKVSNAPNIPVRYHSDPNPCHKRLKINNNIAQVSFAVLVKVNWKCRKWNFCLNVQTVNLKYPTNPNHAHFRLAFKFEDNLHGGCEEGLLKTH